MCWKIIRLFCHWRGSSSLTPVADSLSLIFELVLTRIDDLKPNVLPLSYRVIFINQQRNTARMQEAARSTAWERLCWALLKGWVWRMSNMWHFVWKQKDIFWGKKFKFSWQILSFFFSPCLHLPTQSVLKHRWCDLALHLQNYLHLKWALIRTHIYNSANRHQGY